MQQRAKQGGFTLIELIIVIVVLGILAVTAAPKFIDLTDDADNAAAAGVEGAVAAAANIVRAQWLINGADDNTVTIGPDVITVGNDNADEDGFPAATADGIERAIDLTAGWVGVVGNDRQNPANAGYIFVAADGAVDANDTGEICVHYFLDSGAPQVTRGTFTQGATNVCG